MSDTKEPRAQIINYSKPENQEVPKTVTLLARSDIVFAAVQNLLEGERITSTITSTRMDSGSFYRVGSASIRWTTRSSVSSGVIKVC